MSKFLSYRMQKIGFVCLGLILAGLIYAIAKGCCVPADLISYNKFLDKVHKTMSGRGKTPYCAEQLRQGISREVWYANGTERQKIFITAREAELAYEGIDSDLEIVEHLKEVKGWLQEKLFWQENAPVQLVRHIEADQALYRNAKRVISADNVKMTGYCLPGHQPNLQPMATFIGGRLDFNELDIDSSLSAQSLEVCLLDKTAKLEGEVSFSQKKNGKFPASFTINAGKLSTQIVAIQTIFLEEDVEINYDEKWDVKADYGLYECGEDNPKITLWSETSFCAASSLLDSTQILAKTIETYPKKRVIEFLDPKGTICLKRDENQSEELEFSSATLTWQEENGECILNNDVKVTLPSKNILLTTDKKLLVKKGKEGIRELRSMGTTVVNCNNNEKGFVLTCKGEVLVDHERHFMQMQSANGNEQLLFRDDMGKVYADRAELEYQTISQKIVPLRVVFSGNVLVLNREPPLQQRALADRLTFFFPTNELFFAANPQNRVLFYDQANNLEMSAKGVKVKRDKETKKDSVQGMGDVRFSFDEQEFAQLRQIFEHGITGE